MPVAAAGRGDCVGFQLDEARRGIMAHRDLSDDEIEREMIEEIDRVLGLPKKKLPIIKKAINIYN